MFNVRGRLFPYQKGLVFRCAYNDRFIIFPCHVYIFPNLLGGDSEGQPYMLVCSRRGRSKTATPAAHPTNHK